MRFITACPDCQVQYWSDEPEGPSTIHCYCGRDIALKIAHGKEAQVVRCSSCGAPREKNAASCGFCHSDFTVHEKDLNTVCPVCMARISDHARFCHYCGQKIQPQFSAGRRSASLCPACEPRTSLYFRQEEEKLPFLECRRCAGVWLNMTQFLDVLQEAKSHEPQLWLDKLASPKTQVSSLAGETGGPPSRFYRPCPLCQAIMNRRNLGARSGVIVDYCKPHGLWFDGNELAQWIHWARQGGLQPAAAKAGVRNPSAQTGLLDHLVESVLDLLD